jgi:hypothetical protein
MQDRDYTQNKNQSSNPTSPLPLPFFHPSFFLPPLLLLLLAVSCSSSFFPPTSLLSSCSLSPSLSSSLSPPLLLSASLPPPSPPPFPLSRSPSRPLYKWSNSLNAISLKAAACPGLLSRSLSLPPSFPQAPSEIAACSLSLPPSLPPPKWCTAELVRLPGRRCAWLRMWFGRE